MIRIIVDKGLCKGHGVCMGEAPEVFSVSEEGTLTLLMDVAADELREQLAAAVHYCPTGALSIRDE